MEPESQAKARRSDTDLPTTPHYALAPVFRVRLSSILAHSLVLRQLYKVR